MLVREESERSWTRLPPASAQGPATSQLLDSPGAGGGLLGGQSDSIFSKIFIHSKHC